MAVPRSTLGTILASSASFLLIGAEQSLYGPSFGSFADRFDLDPARLSLSVSLHFLGAFLTIVSSGLLLRHLGYRRLLTGSALALALGTALVGVAGSWALVLTGSFLAGLGFGALNVTTSLLVLRKLPGKVAPVLTLLNALFGLGAIAGPALVALTAPSFEIPFLVAAGSGLLVTILMWLQDSPRPRGVEPLRVAGALRLAGGFMAVYFVYVSAEIGVASWEATHLTPHLGAVRAASLTSLFWAALTLGRLLAVPLAAALHPGTLVLGASLLAFLAALFTPYVPLAPYAYVLMGLAFAPVFPGVLAWLHTAHPTRAEQLAPLAFAGANLGPVLTSPLIGGAVDVAGPGAVPYALIVLSGALVAVSAATRSSDRGRAHHPR